MRQSDFQHLPQEQQLDLLHQHGVYIGKRKVNGHPALLYQLEGFYVEVIYWVHRTYIQKMHITSSIQILEGYIDQVDIQLLLQTVE